MTLIPQQDNMSCWYACARMLVRWKTDKLRMSLVGLVPPELDAECRRIRDAAGGIVNSQILAMARRLGLKSVPPMSPTPEAIEKWLRTYGPLWVNGKRHIVVIAGIAGDRVTVYDPWPVNKGRVDSRPLTGWYLQGVNPPGQPDSSADTGKAVETVFLHNA